MRETVSCEGESEEEGEEVIIESDWMTSDNDPIKPDLRDETLAERKLEVATKNRNGHNPSPSDNWEPGDQTGLGRCVGNIPRELVLTNITTWSVSVSSSSSALECNN